MCNISHGRTCIMYQPWLIHAFFRGEPYLQLGVVAPHPPVPCLYRPTPGFHLSSMTERCLCLLIQGLDNTGFHDRKNAFLSAIAFRMSSNMSIGALLITL